MTYARPSIPLDPWLTRPPRATVPAALRPWLVDPHSLTARIRARCSAFGVEVLEQRLACPQVDEAAALGLPVGERAWLREVLLHANGVPVVYARSVLARGRQGGASHLFHGIGNRPLGAALFSDPRISRQPLHCARLDRRDARYHRLAGKVAGRIDLPASVWARRSVFRLSGRSLLVSEIFLPGILDLTS